MKYAEWTGSAWSIQTVDSEGRVGDYTSIALDSKGHPWISYYDNRIRFKVGDNNWGDIAPTNLKVTVKDEAGNPVSGASVDNGSAKRSDSLKKNSNSDGMVLFRDVKPGSYTIKADKNGYQAATSTVSVASQAPLKSL